MPPRLRAVFIWAAVGLAVLVPLAVAAASPLLQWRQPVYIAAGLAGVAGLALMLLQPLLVAGRLPGLRAQRGRRLHRWTGGALVAAVAVHVAGLWLTSPPDVIDALLFVSPTPFSAWGVIAMWAVFGAAALALVRKRVGLGLWRGGHSALVSVAVAGTVIHAVQIEGTMGTLSKWALCLLVPAVLAATLYQRRPWTALRRTVR